MPRKTTMLLMLASLVAVGATAKPIQTSVSDRGTLIRGDREVFPFGIYHVSWIGERYGKDRFQDMLAMQGNGLGIMKTSLDPTSRESDLALLDDAAERGMGIMAELYLPSLGLLIDRMKEYPAVISWQIGDDFNVTNSKNYCSPQLLRERHELAKKHDPGHVTYASGGSALVEWYRSFKDYHGCVDLIGIQCYPVGNKTDFPAPVLLERCHQLFKARVKELEESKIVPIANLQSFSWKKKKGIFPTPSESRNMLYGALAAGVKGALYYTFYDGQNMEGNVTLDLQAPGLWEEIGRQAQELVTLEPFLLHGIHQEIRSHNERIHISSWTKDKDRILVIINTDRKIARELEAEIPDSLNAHAKPLFANRPAGLELVNGVLRGTIKPEEVHVYAITGAGPENSPDKK